MSKSVDMAKALLDSLNLEASTDWTIEDVIVKRDGNKAAEIIRLVTTDKEFKPTKVGERARTDKATAKKMLELRGILNRFNDDEGNEDYRPFWKEMLELNDYYFLLFVKDLYQIDNTLMDKVNELRNREDSAKANELQDKEAKKAEANQKKQALANAVNAKIQAGEEYQVFIAAARKDDEDIQIESFSDEDEASEWVESFDKGRSGYGAILVCKKNGSASVGTRKLYTA